MAKKPAGTTAVPIIPCSYGCGRNAQGTLTLNFTEWRERAPYREGRDTRSIPDGGFYVNIAACQECVRGAVKLKVVVPDDRT